MTIISVQVRDRLLHTGSEDILSQSAQLGLHVVYGEHPFYIS